MFRSAPGNDATAEAMRAQAEVFVRSIPGCELGWDGSDVARLDELCDQFGTPGRRIMSTRSALSTRMGAYVGELLVRNAGGRWVYDTEYRSAGVELPGERRVFPAERVAQRIAVGHHHSIAEFYRATLAGDLLSYPHRQAG